MKLSTKDLDYIVSEVLKRLKQNARQEILDLLDANPRGLTTNEICDKLDKGGKEIDAQLQRAKLKGLVMFHKQSGLWKRGDGIAIDKGRASIGKAVTVDIDASLSGDDVLD